MNWYLAVLKNYAGFSGRARRQEYWMFLLIHILILFALYVPFILTQEPALMAPYVLYGLAVLIPSLAAIVRRLHDTGRSGWWYFINFVPLVGSIILIVFLAQDSKPDANQYGASPKYS